MQAQFWHDLWHKREIGFHLADTNPIILKHFEKLALNKGNRIFLPLCGKTRDIHWFLSQGYQVVGIELHENAIIELFEEMQITPTITHEKSFKVYSAPQIKIFVGDYFVLDRETLGDVDAIYDRASIVALPPQMRKEYSNHLILLTKCAPKLLVTFEYDQAQMDGPPFSVHSDEVSANYHEHYNLTLLETKEMHKSFTILEKVWLLTSK